MIQLIEEKYKTTSEGVGTISHYVMSDDSDFQHLPAEAGTGSTAVSGSGKVYYKFPEEWREV